jgi:hypothetical protein
MLATIELDYHFDSTAQKLDDDQWGRLRMGFTAIDLPETKPEKYSLPYNLRSHTIDLATTGELLISMGFSFSIKRFNGCHKVANEGDRTVNIQIAIPNLLLFAVDEVMVMEDDCTDRLQRNLDDGWRILAVCPAINQRRPDYILGRQKDAQRD